MDVHTQVLYQEAVGHVAAAAAAVTSGSGTCQRKARQLQLLLLVLRSVMQEAQLQGTEYAAATA
jgi:hypothetical protein